MTAEKKLLHIMFNYQTLAYSRTAGSCCWYRSE